MSGDGQPMHNDRTFEMVAHPTESFGRCIRWKAKSNRCTSKGYPLVLGDGLCIDCWDRRIGGNHKTFYKNGTEITNASN